MSSKSLEWCGPRNRSSSSEDDVDSVERPSKKRHFKPKKFVIHPYSLNATYMELHRVRRTDCTTIPLDDGKSETEIRELLEQNYHNSKELGTNVLRKERKEITFVPARLNAHSDSLHMREKRCSEWNTKNIKKMAKGNKVVYIHPQVKKAISFSPCFYHYCHHHHSHDLPYMKLP